MNNMKVEFEALPENEGFARVAVAAFLTPLNPTLEEIEMCIRDRFPNTEKATQSQRALDQLDN